MGVIRYKIWSDLWRNKGRTLQVVLIIAMGAFTIGMIIGGSNLIRTGLSSPWQASSPAMIQMWADPPLDDDQLLALKNLKGVDQVEGLLSTTIEWRLSPDDAWSPAGLIARDDYDNQHYSKLQLISGNWPTGRIFAMEKGADTYFDLHQGEQVYIRVDEREHMVKIGGVVSNQFIFPASMGGSAQFYTTRDRFGELTGERDFNQFLAGAPLYDETLLTDVADRMQRQLEKQDIDSGGAAPPEGTRTANPEKHFAQDILDGIFLMLGIMSGLILILGLFLVYNTVNTILTQQVDQVGIMKAIGARTGQILWVYLVTVFIYGLLALIIAVPLGVIGAYIISRFMLNFFIIDPGPLTISPPAVLVQVVIALLAPLLASLIPIFAGARITVREAISTYGLGGAVGLLDRLVVKAERVSRPVLLTISNTFRNRGRVFLIQITLVGSGLIFMMVMSVRDSAIYTYDDILSSILRFNVTMRFEESERAHLVERLTLAQPEVKAVEMWSMTQAKIRPAGQLKTEDDENADLFGVPLPTTLYGPQMRAGRWLQPDDTYVVVLNQKLAEDAGIGLGDWVTFDHGFQGESTWQVAGLLFDPIIAQSAHVPRDVLLKEIGSVNKANTVWVQMVRADPAGEEAIARKLRQYYEQHLLDISAGGTFGLPGDTASGLIESILFRFGIIITLLATMAIIIAIVGSIGLNGILSLSVLERRREIGVMRAIGASSGRIAGLFIGEGLILGLLSWLIALPLSIPAGYLMTQALAVALQGEIVYKYTPTGALYWLGIITVLSIAASWFPAWGATRVSVRESLAYQ